MPVNGPPLPPGLRLIGFAAFTPCPGLLVKQATREKSISVKPPPGFFTLCDFPLHVPGSLDVACRLLRELWIHRFRSSHMGFVISCPHGTLERDAEDQ